MPHLIQAIALLTLGLTCLAVGCILGRLSERSRRGGTLDLVGVSPSSEKNATVGLREPFAFVGDADAATEAFERTRRRVSALQRCNPSRGLHYGEGDTCECGLTLNVAGVPHRLEQESARTRGGV